MYNIYGKVNNFNYVSLSLKLGYLDPLQVICVFEVGTVYLEYSRPDHCHS